MALLTCSFGPRVYARAACTSSLICDTPDGTGELLVPRGGGRELLLLCITGNETGLLFSSSSRLYTCGWMCMHSLSLQTRYGPSCTHGVVRPNSVRVDYIFLKRKKKWMRLSFLEAQREICNLSKFDFFFAMHFLWFRSPITLDFPRPLAPLLLYTVVSGSLWFKTPREREGKEEGKGPCDWVSVRISEAVKYSSLRRLFASWRSRDSMVGPNHNSETSSFQ